MNAYKINERTFKKLCSSTFCYVAIKHKLRIDKKRKSYYHLIMLLICCIKVKYGHEYLCLIKSKILNMIFYLNKKNFNEIKTLYFIFRDGKRVKESKCLSFYEKYEQRIEERNRFNDLS